jgi:hypothetical protein
MKLSPREEKMVLDLEKNVSDVKRMRWLFLFLGILLICMSVGIAIYYSIFGSPEWIKHIIGKPEFYLMTVAGGISLGWATKGFKGDPVRELIIKVIRESAKDS